MTINCGLTNDERRLGRRCSMIGCYNCEEFDRVCKDSPAIDHQVDIPSTRFAEAVKVNLKTSSVMIQMLLDDHNTEQAQRCLDHLEEAIKWLDFHIGEIEKRFK